MEFDSKEEGEEFEPLPWMGIEITATPLGRDAKLSDLDREHFLSLLNQITPDTEPLSVV